jgi:hypothetical protein
MGENTVLLIALGVGAYYLLNGMGGGTPIFRNASGQVINEIVCGATMTFEVSGYSRVWLSQLKNGVLDYDGPFNVPMPAYITQCSRDVAQYELAIYKIDANNVKGELIGQTSFKILPHSV